MRQFTPKQAWAWMQSNPKAVLIDVRTEMEHLYVGHPPGARHVAWVEYPDFTPEPERFVAQVRKEIEDPGLTVLLICRSGKRSLEAGKVLEAAGFADVVNVLHGFEGDLDDQHHRSTLNGWRAEGLPWGQF